jgi:hypothetical protein
MTIFLLVFSWRKSANNPTVLPPATLSEDAMGKISIRIFSNEANRDTALANGLAES